MQTIETINKIRTFQLLEQYDNYRSHDLEVLPQDFVNNRPVPRITHVRLDHIKDLQ